MTKLSTHHPTLRIFGAVLFTIGIILATSLAAIAIISDYESVFYGFERLGAKNLPTVSCPVLLIPNAPGYVRATIKNQNERPVDLTMRVSFSSPGPFVYDKYKEHFEANQTKNFVWEVTEDNVDLERYVFAHIGHYATFGFSFRNMNCGMMMIGFPLLSGDQLFLLWYTFGIGSLLFGLFLWHSQSKPIEGRRRLYYQYMRFLAIIVLITLLVALLNNWVIGIALLAIIVLAFASLLMIPMMNT